MECALPSEIVVSKSQYAAMRRRTAAAISSSIKSGKLRPPALIGVGYKARIHVQLADEQLGWSASGKRAAVRARATTVQPRQHQPAAAALPQYSVSHPDLQRRLKARAAREEAEAAIVRQHALAENGRWVLRDDVDRVWRGELARLAATVEAWLPDLGQRLAVDFERDPKLVTELLLRQFQPIRARQADPPR